VAGAWRWPLIPF